MCPGSCSSSSFLSPANSTDPTPKPVRKRNGAARKERQGWCSARQRVLCHTTASWGGGTWQGLKVKIFYAKGFCENRDVLHSNMQNFKVSKYSSRHSSVFSKTSPLLRPGPVAKGGRRQSAPCRRSPCPGRAHVQHERCGAHPALHSAGPATPLQSPPYGS